MRAYYINLAHRTDRRASIEGQLQRLGIDAQRIEALTPQTLPPALLAQHAALGEFNRLSLREFSLNASHVVACRTFLASNDKHALILEDDIVLSERLPAFLTAFEQNPAGIDLLRLETFNAPVQISSRPRGELGGFALHSMHGWIWGSAAYVISRGTARRLVNTPQALENIIDRVLFRPHRTVLGPVKRRQVVPALAIQADRMEGAVWGGDSDLAPGRAEGLKAPKPPPGKAFTDFVENEILIGLPTVLHRALGLSHKRPIPFDPA